jgi:hypothetical protein
MTIIKIGMRYEGVCPICLCKFLAMRSELKVLNGMRTFCVDCPECGAEVRVAVVSEPKEGK